MNSIALKKMKLIQNISKLPEPKIGEVDSFIQKILSQVEVKKPEPINLKGIWKNKGFEKIADLEEVIKIALKELNEAILTRTF